MASRVGGVVQENSSVGWKTNDVSKGPRKGVLGGRTPLGDLSNALKRSMNQASTKQKSSMLPLYEKETGASASQKGKSINTQASKKLQSTGRKALSDISNSGRPNLNKGSKISNFAKLSVLEEEPIEVGEIVGEQFLHNHQECIKAQSKAMDLDQFLRTIGLDSNISKDEETPMPYQSPPRQFQLEEMAEELITKDKPLKLKYSSEPDSPPPVRSPNYYMDLECNFELRGSPQWLNLPKQ